MILSCVEVARYAKKNAAALRSSGCFACSVIFAALELSTKRIPTAAEIAILWDKLYTKLGPGTTSKHINFTREFEMALLKICNLDQWPDGIHILKLAKGNSTHFVLWREGSYIYDSATSMASVFRDAVSWLKVRIHEKQSINIVERRTNKFSIN